MNWLKDFVKPKIRAFVGNKSAPDNLWKKCPSCGQMLFHRDLKSNLQVCNNCNHHLNIEPVERFKSIFDEESFQLLDLPNVQTDPLKFRDTKRYTERLRDNRNKTGSKEAILAAIGKIGKIKSVSVAQNFSFMGGSMGLATGESIVEASRVAVSEKSALIVFASAGGARMQEGILSLMQMPRTIIAIELIREAKLPYIVVLTNPTTGGVTASYAMLGDISIAEPNALIGFAGPRVIEGTIREKLPEGFQRSEYLLEHGMIDMVVNRREMRNKLVQILNLLVNKEDLIGNSSIKPPLQ